MLLCCVCVLVYVSSVISAGLRVVRNQCMILLDFLASLRSTREIIDDDSFSIDPLCLETKAYPQLL